MAGRKERGVDNVVCGLSQGEVVKEKGLAAWRITVAKFLW